MNHGVLCNKSLALLATKIICNSFSVFLQYLTTRGVLYNKSPASLATNKSCVTVKKKNRIQFVPSVMLTGFNVVPQCGSAVM